MLLRLSVLCGALLVLTLTGCGQKGPLYLPDQAEMNKAESLKKAIEQHKQQKKAAEQTATESQGSGEQ